MGCSTNIEKKNDLTNFIFRKWHLGFHEKSYTPTLRGFDSHFGYLGPYIGYYDHSLIMFDRNYSRGYDMRRNLEMMNDVKGKYATDLFTNEAVNLIHDHDVSQPLFLLLTHLAPHAGNEDKPMEAPEEIIKKFEYIKDEKRKTLAAMIDVMDDGIGKVVEAIKNKGILENTIIMFMSGIKIILFNLFNFKEKNPADNGGPTEGIHSTQASNHPLRGQKASVWEGASRVPACIYSPLIKNSRRVSNEFMYMTDVLPTMLSAAKIPINVRNLDGINQWQVLSENLPTIRKEILYNIESVLSYSAIMNDGWKLVNGTNNLKFAGWLGDLKNNSKISFEKYSEKVLNSKTAKSLPTLTTKEIKIIQEKSTVKCRNTTINECNPLEFPCLFNVIDDPCERHNLAKEKPEKIKFLLSRLSHHITEMVPSRRAQIDPMCDPKLHNFQWTWWIDEGVKFNDEEPTENIFMLGFCFFVFAVVITILFLRYVREEVEHNKL